MIRFEANELREFAAEMPRLGVAGGRAMVKVMIEGGNELRDKWRDNAKETAGEHGRLYPNSIEANMRVSTDIVIDIGPNPNKPQGGMSFEFGSSKQPAHLDGQRAADEVLPVIRGRLTTALFHLGL